MFTDCPTEDEFLSRFADHVTSSNIVNAQMTEMTTHQRAYIMSADGFAYFDRLLDRLYYSSNSRRVDEALSNLRASRRDRLRPASDQREITYVVSRGGNRIYSSRDYKAGLQSYKDLGKLVREAIRTGNTDELAEFFVDGSIHELYYAPRKTHERIKKALDDKLIDFYVTYCDCGHFEHNHDTHEVRNDTWCDSCFNDEIGRAHV